MTNYEIKIFRKYYKGDRVSSRKDKFVDSFFTQKKDEDEFYSVIKEIQKKYNITGFSNPIAFNEKSSWILVYTSNPMYYIKLYGNKKCLEWLLENMKQNGDIETYIFKKNDINEEAFPDMVADFARRKDAIKVKRELRKKEWINNQTELEMRRMRQV